MKPLLILCLSFSLLLPLSAQIQPDFNFVERQARHETKSQLRLKNLTESVIGINYDLKYHRLEWEIDPSVYYISGSVFSVFEMMADNADFIRFDLAHSLSVDSVLYHGEKIDFDHWGYTLFIRFGQSLPKSSIDSVQIFYQGEPLNDGSGAFTQKEHEGSPIISTLSEPYGAKNWWPCKQNLNDKIDSVDIYIKHPQGYIAASNGVLQYEMPDGDQIIAYWKHRHPVAAYLIALSVTNYERYSDYAILNNGDSLEILNYVYPEDLDYAKGKTPFTVDVFDIYHNLFIDYPFKNEKYGHAQWNYGGGMEHQTMSFMGNFEVELVAHELAHSWFGDYITCGSWQDIWLNEGFATYLTGMVYEHIQNGYWWDRWKQVNIARVTASPAGSVFVRDTSLVSRVFDARLSYSKAALVLHMLRWELGDADFFKAVNNYLRDPELINNYAYTDDLKKHFEAAGDTVLDEFFNDWIYGEGHPEYAYTWYQNDLMELNIDVEQNSSHSSVDFFEMNLPFTLWAQGKDSCIALKNTHSPQSFSLNPGYSIDSVQFDPDQWIIHPEAKTMSTKLIDKNQMLQLYPNPCSDIIHIKIRMPQERLQINMFDSKGQRVYQRELAGFQEDILINTRNLKKGIHYLELRASNYFIMKKILKL